jgi:hypothetical protein
VPHFGPPSLSLLSLFLFSLWPVLCPAGPSFYRPRHLPAQLPLLSFTRSPTDGAHTSGASPTSRRLLTLAPHPPPWPQRTGALLPTPALFPLPSTSAAFNARRHPRAASHLPLPLPPHRLHRALMAPATTGTRRHRLGRPLPFPSRSYKRWIHSPCFTAPLPALSSLVQRRRRPKTGAPPAPEQRRPGLLLRSVSRRPKSLGKFQRSCASFSSCSRRNPRPGARVRVSPASCAAGLRRDRRHQQSVVVRSQISGPDLSTLESTVESNGQPKPPPSFLQKFPCTFKYHINVLPPMKIPTMKSFFLCFTPELLIFHVLKFTLHLLLVSPPSFTYNYV